MRSRLLFVAALAAFASVSGCITRVEPPPAGPDSRSGATDGVQGLEGRLQAAPTLQLKFSIASQGVVSAAIQGTLQVANGNLAHLDATGTLDGKPAKPTLASDGKRMQGGSLDKMFSTETPSGLGAALVLGLTRMGLLHNLVALSGGNPPEGADGPMDGFARAIDVVRAPPEVVRGITAERYDFKVEVRGKVLGEATIWLNPQNGLPLRRHQVVHFPDGEMTVDETYEAFTVGAPIDPRAFEVGPAALEI